MSFVGSKVRSMRIDLEWPVEFGGRIWESIPLKRLTHKEVADWVEEIKAQDASVQFPVLREEDGTPLPDGLLDALDADDFDEVNKAVLNFLPRRFRGAIKNASAPQAGGITD